MVATSARGAGSTPQWDALRLRDRIEADAGVLFVGINPGVRSAITGHHFAGHSNRFWKLLWEARLVPERLTYLDDRRLPEWGFGITNLIARPSRGTDALRPQEYVEGWRVLRRKIRRVRPEIVALVGVTLYRAIVRLLDTPTTPTPPRRGTASVLGPSPYQVEGAALFVLPNPSGRNANFTYGEMLEAYRQLASTLRRRGLRR